MEVLVSQIPYGIEIMSLVVAIAGLVSAVVPDSKIPVDLYDFANRIPQLENSVPWL